MLFDKNGYYLVGAKNTPTYDFVIDIMGEDNTCASLLYDLDGALKRGNLFKNMYDPYKNYEPSDIRVKTEREKCLLEIQELDFAIGDLNLYLDLWPEDKSTYDLFTKYIKMYEAKKDEYKRLYGPLTLDSITDEYEWSMGVWPWEEGRI